MEILKRINKILKTIFGMILLTIGIFLLLLPGPGILTIIFALAVLSSEFKWAKNILNYLKHHTKKIHSKIKDKLKNKFKKKN